MLVLLLSTMSFAQADFKPEDHDGIKRPVEKDKEEVKKQHEQLRTFFLDRRPYIAPKK
jgi:hypothetical protein